jgi:hypothetical protein
MKIICHSEQIAHSAKMRYLKGSVTNRPRTITFAACLGQVSRPGAMSYAVLRVLCWLATTDGINSKRSISNS